MYQLLRGDIDVFNHLAISLSSSDSFSLMCSDTDKKKNQKLGTYSIKNIASSQKINLFTIK